MRPVVDFEPNMSRVAFHLQDVIDRGIIDEWTCADVPPDVVPLPMLGFEAPAVQEVGAF
jgi:hypothetical protein